MHDGAVLPILHLNGYKIANPTVLARIPKEELEQLMMGYGYKPYFVEGDDPEKMHQLFAATLDTVLAEIKQIQTEARTNGFTERPQWPMIVLNSPKGWTGPKRSRWSADRRHMACAPGAAGRTGYQARAYKNFRKLDEKLQTGRIV